MSITSSGHESYLFPDGKKNEASHSITTQAEIEINPHIPSDITGEGEVDKGPRLKEESDSDLSPEYMPKLRLRRERRAVRRSKSALETCSVPGPMPGDQKSGTRMSLPAYSRVPVAVASEQILHKPHQEALSTVPDAAFETRCVVSATNLKKPSKSDTFRHRTQTPSTKSLEHVKDKVRKRSQSIANDVIPQEQLSTALNVSPSLQRPASLSISSYSSDSRSTHSPQSSADGSSEISLGEMYIPSFFQDKQVSTFPGHKPKSRPGSGGTSSSANTLTEHGYNPSVKTAGRPKDSSAMFKIDSFLKGTEKRLELRQPHQNGVMGFDWLFSTDSDSLTSGESQSHADVSDSTSTVTNEEDSSYELSSDQQNILYQPLDGLECTTSPSSPSTDELEMMKSRGAIPKHYPWKNGRQPSPPGNAVQKLPVTNREPVSNTQ